MGVIPTKTPIYSLQGQKVAKKIIDIVMSPECSLLKKVKKNEEK